MLKRYRNLLAALLASVSLLAACGGQNGGEAPSYPEVHAAHLQQLRHPLRVAFGVAEDHYPVQLFLAQYPLHGVYFVLHRYLQAVLEDVRFILFLRPDRYLYRAGVEGRNRQSPYGHRKNVRLRDSNYCRYAV